MNGSNFTILRTEIININRAAYCDSNCLIQDSYFHGTNLWPDVSNLDARLVGARGAEPHVAAQLDPLLLHRAVHQRTRSGAPRT